MTEPWRDNAACLGLPEDLFFPASGAQAAKNYPRAKAICRKCEVSDECLAYALEMMDGDTYANHGVWGGTTPPERRILWQRRQSDASNAGGSATPSDRQQNAPTCGTLDVPGLCSPNHARPDPCPPGNSPSCE